ncbi:MAG: alpha/beta hydrolase [Planctomycetota bacterium]
MAFIQCDFHSETLRMACSMNVILPQATSSSQIGMPSRAEPGRHKVLYLLHGLSDDHTIWMRRTSIERYVAPYGIAVVMPAVHRSFYTDMDRGGRYWTFVSEELPRLCREFFPLSKAREDNFVAGLSMGGYGAFKMALACPESFGGAVSLSGALDVARLVSAMQGDATFQEELVNIFGDVDAIAGTDNDLLKLLGDVADSGRPRPRLFAVCGTDDLLLTANRTFRDEAETLDYPLDYREDKGTHEWGFWDRWMPRVLQWMLVGDRASGPLAEDDDA